MTETIYFDSPAFKVLYSPEKISYEIDSVLKKKNWRKISVGELKLIYVPYWFCSYDAYSEDEKKTISKLKSGKVALNALTNELDEKIAKLLDANSEIENYQSQYKFELETTLIEKSDALESLTLRIAKEIGVPREKVVIFGLAKRYVPFWVASSSIGKGNIRLLINGCSGKILNEDDIPEQTAGWGEAITETFSDLKEPKAWADYASGVGRTLFQLTQSATAEQQKSQSIASLVSFFESPLFVVLLGIIAIIAAMFAFGYF